MSQENHGKDAHAVQTNLDGKRLHSQDQDEPDRSEEIQILKSALQKAIRRGQAEKAMYYADRLVRLNAYSCWRRLRIIAVEDVSFAGAVMAVELLYRHFLDFKGTDKSGPSWDGRRDAINAARILAELPKDRRSDEFLELEAVAEEGNEKAKAYLDELAKYDDWVFDQHTTKGRKMGRGDEYWIEVSSQTVDRTEEYVKWRLKWESLMKCENPKPESEGERVLGYIG